MKKIVIVLLAIGFLLISQVKEGHTQQSLQDHLMASQLQAMDGGGTVFYIINTKENKVYTCTTSFSKEIWRCTDLAEIKEKKFKNNK